MTVQEMDISLNISASPVAGKTKKVAGYKKEFFKPQFKREVKKIARDKARAEPTAAGPKHRVKQKSLAAIVSRNLGQGGGATAFPKTETRLEPDKPQSQPKQATDLGSKSQDQLIVSSEADKPIVSFAKPGKQTGIKTILAKRRETGESKEKKSLVDIFGEKSSIAAISLPSKSETPGFNGAKRKFSDAQAIVDSKSPRKKGKFNDARNLQAGNTEIKNVSFKNAVENASAKAMPSRTGGSGKISSLFGNNPEIPNLGQRFVEPVNEAVFSSSKFTDFDLHPFTVSNLEQNMQITKLTTVQQKAIPHILSGKDVLVRSQTGSGKTLAYALPIVESLHKVRPKLTRDSGLRALVIVPTRELALQTYECFLKLIKPFTWIVPGYLVGGEKRKAEKARLRKGCNLLVATPGRLLDHVKHTEALRLHDVQCFVLDEADRMLDMGYEKDISGIVSALEEQKGLPRFGVKKFVKIETDNSGYNPLAMLRQNGKKTFTDEDVDSMLTETSKIGEKEDSSLPVEPPSNIVNAQRAKPSDNVAVDSEVEENEAEDEDDNEFTIQREYHSGTDSDPEKEEQEFPIRNERNKRKKPLPLSLRDKTRIIASRHKIQAVVSESESNDSNDNSDGEKNTKEIYEVADTTLKNQSKRQTVLLSATLTQAVEKLAGLTMDNPVIVDAARENLIKSGGNVAEINEDLIVPQSVNQTYVVTPPKLRLVSLSAYIAGKCQAAGQHKILVFMATQDMVDYHAEILTSVLCKQSDEDDEDSEPLVDVEFFKLHGNMTQKERTEVFKTFRAAKSGVLLCTDVAARGLDLPKVDSVVQYTGPLSARDYVHRVGRTARAGSSGSAVIFLTPPEVEFVRMLESRRVRIRQEDMTGILDKLLGPISQHNSVQAAATALQNQFETLVLEDKEMHRRACKAYVSWIRFYASYPKDMREIFDRRELHLGHFAKSFGLRDPPQKIGGVGKTIQHDDIKNKIHNNRLSNERPKKIFTKKQGGGGPGSKPNALKKVRMLNTSEYASGLETVKKQKKF
ncbi:probable ATP-dependent RNA helicase DDX31 [Neodiprion virginianus]|uniref:probable ATP-dependent RNA helicase DDX31 n=1 Tax=Neodiprion virginianus TaxID=2961670 RepID=UPI001EE6CD84|nr:probable ATP-dependent RNA helicase DDX31 [Neodiprion virginianus]XP_046614737.1 probable ATP-dependent RNA helicase DDX31 [Neodiprion virginianus]